VRWLLNSLFSTNWKLNIYSLIFKQQNNFTLHTPTWAPLFGVGAVGNKSSSEVAIFKTACQKSTWCPYLALLPVGGALMWIERSTWNNSRLHHLKTLKTYLSNIVKLCTVLKYCCYWVGLCKIMLEIHPKILGILLFQKAKSYMVKWRILAKKIYILRIHQTMFFGKKVHQRGADLPYPFSIAKLQPQICNSDFSRIGLFNNFVSIHCTSGFYW